MLLGLIGAGIAKSLTPAMHEQEGAHQGLRVHYQRIDLAAAGAAVDELPLLLQAARIMGFSGLNITYPCKQAVIPLLAGLSDEARAIGAVNTLVLRDGAWVGHNTDCSGWAWGFRRTLPEADLSHVLLLGAGGAGCAIAHAVLHLGVKRLDVYDTDMARAQKLATELAHYASAKVQAVTQVQAALAQATGLINATPTGMDAYPGSPVAAAWLKPPMWVADAVYFPLQTQLLRDAQARGCATVDGGTMAVGQALDAFALFTGQPADARRMAAHFQQLLQARGD